VSQLPLSTAATIVLLSAGLLSSALAVVASTHQVREGYARLQDLELRRWELQEQYTRLLLEANTWASPHRISQIASETLSMQAPDLGLSQVIAE
jgi:cell division protein FtsL